MHGHLICERLLGSPCLAAEVHAALMHGHSQGDPLWVDDNAAEVHAALMHGHGATGLPALPTAEPQRFTRL